MILAIGADHAGFHLKEILTKLIKQKGNIVLDFGTSNEESCDYPDIAHPLAEAIEAEKADLGVAICGSGNGINMTLNKHQNIRAALCWNLELATLARQHNNANVLTLPARFIDHQMAIDCLEAFITTEFEGGRHVRRVNKINI